MASSRCSSMRVFGTTTTDHIKTCRYRIALARKLVQARQEHARGSEENDSSGFQDNQAAILQGNTGAMYPMNSATRSRPVAARTISYAQTRQEDVVVATPLQEKEVSHSRICSRPLYMTPTPSTRCKSTVTASSGHTCGQIGHHRTV